jgi:hypothetical protein
LRERGDAEKGDEDHTRKCSHHHSTSLAIYTNGEVC